MLCGARWALTAEALVVRVRWGSGAAVQVRCARGGGAARCVARPPSPSQPFACGDCVRPCVCRCSAAGLVRVRRCPSTHVLDPNRDELLLLPHWRHPPCWKRGGEFGQIDDNRWSAIRQGGVPQSRNSLNWGFVGAFSSFRPACRKTARFAPCDHRLSCVCPNSGAFSQQPPLRDATGDYWNSVYAAPLRFLRDRSNINP